MIKVEASAPHLVEEVGWPVRKKIGQQHRLTFVGGLAGEGEDRDYCSLPKRGDAGKRIVNRPRNSMTEGGGSFFAP